jgi:Transport and Golgi organisation 2
VQQLKARVKQAVSGSSDAEDLANALFTALADPEPAPDHLLPHTGVSMDWERMLSPAFIKPGMGLYGTRCSTLVITERVNKRLVTHVLERTYSATSTVAMLRRVTLKNWPPRHSMAEAEVAKLEATLPPPGLRHEHVADEEHALNFESGEISDHDHHTLAEPSAIRKTRARSLIKPSKVRPLKV